MNSFTKVLLEDLLEADDKKVTAIYGGGFKPPTKGHFNVIEKAAEQNPEIDDIIIYVGAGERDGISQGESLQIWELYKKYLPIKTIVEPVKAPVGDILRYAKEHPDETVLWIIGARENNPEDFNDIASRTRTIDKYPNLQLRVIQTAGGVSGTAARKAVRDNNKEQFFHLIPDIEEKEQVWDIVSPIIKENRIENIKTKFQKFLSAIKQESQETKEVVGLLIHAAQGKIQLSDKDKEYIGNQLKDVLKTVGLISIATLPGGLVAGALIKLFKAEHLITPSSMMNEVGEANLKPYKWEEVDIDGYWVYTRFITDSETQYDVDVKSTVYFPPGQLESYPALEIEFSAKPKGAEGSSSKIVVNKGEMYRVMSTIADIIKKYIKKFKSRAIIYSPSKKSSEENFGVQRDNLYRAFISKAIPGVTFKQSGDFVTAVLPNTISEADPKKGTGKKPEGSGRRLYTDEDPKDTVRIKFKTKEDIVDTLNKTSFKAKSHARQSQVINLIHQRVRAAYGKAKDPEVKSRLKRALDYIERRKEASKKKTERLRKMKEASDPQAGTALPYGSGFAPVKELVTSTDIICDNCGWEWAKKDGGDDLYICHKCGHDNTPTQLNEGRYDSISRQLASYTLKGWKDDAEHNEPTGRVEFEVGPGKDLEYGDLEFLYKGVAVFAGIQTYSHNGYAKLKSGEIGVTYSIPKSMIPQGWEEIYMDLISTIRHEIEHLTQGGVNLKQGKEILDRPLRQLVSKYPDILRYLLLPSEKDANIQGLYLKAKKWRRPYSEVVDEYIRDFLKITNKNDVDILKGIYDKRAKELNLPSIKENDPFGIKAYARELVNEALKDTWNPKESFVSLSKFMIDKGMNIQPLPKVKIISDDEENASNLLGKTAYYNPNDKSITLYTKDRHPKDICRSFTHEMIHHEQNLEGRLNNINTTNTNEDGALPEIEKEAYEKGNMMFRNWEDSIKNV